MQNSYSDNRVSRGSVLTFCAQLFAPARLNHPGTNVYTIIFNPLVSLFSYSRLFLLYSHHTLFLTPSPAPPNPPSSIVIHLLIRYQTPFLLCFAVLFYFLSLIILLILFFFIFFCIYPHQPLVSPSNYFAREYGLGHYYFTTVGTPISFSALFSSPAIFC